MQQHAQQRTPGPMYLLNAEGAGSAAWAEGHTLQAEGGQGCVGLQGLGQRCRHLCAKLVACGVARGGAPAGQV